MLSFTQKPFQRSIIPSDYSRSIIPSYILTPSNSDIGSDPPAYLMTMEISKIFPDIRRQLDQGKKVLDISGPTGTGKTAGSAIIIHQWCVANWKDKYRYTIVAIPLRANTLEIYKFSVEKNQQSKDLFSYRADEKNSSNFGISKIKYMTTMSVVNRLLLFYKTTPKLINGIVLCIDETHQSSVENKILLGLANYFITLEFEIKVVLISATPPIIDPKYLPNLVIDNADKLVIPTTPNYDITWIDSRLTPIVLCENKDKSKSKSKSKSCKVDASRIIPTIIEKLQYYNTQSGNILLGNGHILIFVPGQSFIKELINKIKEYNNKSASKIRQQIKVYTSSLAKKDKSLSFNDSTIILATNALQSGITIQNVNVVIDPLIENVSSYTNGIRMLKESVISKDSSKQRIGRCGRGSKKGQVYILTTETAYIGLNEHSEFKWNDMNIYDNYIKILGSNPKDSEDPKDPKDPVYPKLNPKIILGISKHQNCETLKTLEKLKFIENVKSDKNFDGSNGGEISYTISDKSTNSMDQIFTNIYFKSAFIEIINDEKLNDEFLVIVIILFMFIDTSIDNHELYLVNEEEIKQGRESMKQYLERNFNTFIKKNDTQVGIKNDDIQIAIKIYCLMKKSGESVEDWCTKSKINYDFMNKLDKKIIAFFYQYYIDPNKNPEFYDEIINLSENNELMYTHIYDQLSELFFENIFEIKVRRYPNESGKEFKQPYKYCANSYYTETKEKTDETTGTKTKEITEIQFKIDDTSMILDKMDILPIRTKQNEQLPIQNEGEKILALLCTGNSTFDRKPSKKVNKSWYLNIIIPIR